MRAVIGWAISLIDAFHLDLKDHAVLSERDKTLTDYYVLCSLYGENHPNYVLTYCIYIVVSYS